MKRRLNAVELTPGEHMVETANGGSAECLVSSSKHHQHQGAVDSH